MPIYNGGGGVAGITVETDPSALKMANNLSDLVNKATARTNLQLPSYFAALSHGHAISDVTNLQTSLDGKAATSHSHAITDVTNLQTTLNGKAASVHTHDVSDVTGWGSIQDAGSNTVLSWSGSALIWVSRGISDAPSDGSQYARQNGAWAVVTGGGGGGGISDAPADSNVYARVNNTWVSLFDSMQTAATQSWVNGLGFQTASDVSTYVTGLGYQTASNVSTYVTGLGYITEAPTDGQQYVRQTLMGTPQWVLNAGFTFSDAPMDSNKYLRMNNVWTLYDGISDAPNDGSTYGRQNLGWVSIPSAILTAASAGTNASGYSNAQFDTVHYPSELALTINGTTYYVPART